MLGRRGTFCDSEAVKSAWGESRATEEAHMTNRKQVLEEVFELALHNDMTYFG